MTTPEELALVSVDDFLSDQIAERLGAHYAGPRQSFTHDVPLPAGRTLVLHDQPSHQFTGIDFTDQTGQSAFHVTVDKDGHVISHRRVDYDVNDPQYYIDAWGLPDAAAVVIEGIARAMGISVAEAAGYVFDFREAINKILEAVPSADAMRRRRRGGRRAPGNRRRRRWIAKEIATHAG